MRREALKTKIKNADKVRVFSSPKTEKRDQGIFILAYKQESQGYQSNYERITVVYFIGINMSKKFWDDRKYTGKNIQIIEDSLKDTTELVFNPEVVSIIDNMPDYRTYRYK